MDEEICLKKGVISIVGGFNPSEKYWLNLILSAQPKWYPRLGRLGAFPKYVYLYMSDGLNLLHPRKDMAEMVIVFCVSPIVPEGLALWT